MKNNYGSCDAQISYWYTEIREFDNITSFGKIVEDNC